MMKMMKVGDSVTVCGYEFFITAIGDGMINMERGPGLTNPFFRDRDDYFRDNESNHWPS